MHLLTVILGELVLPPFLFAWLACAGVLLMRRRPRVGRAMVWASAGLLLLSAFPALSLLLGGGLSRQSPTLQYQPPPWPEAQAIVILGGGRRPFAVEYGQPETAEYSTLMRLRYGARLYREYRLPVLVTGGRPHMWASGRGTLSEAEIMRDILQDEMGVPVRWVEPEADDTLGNARLSVPMLKAAGVQRIYLVTSADHADRAREAFEQAGMDVFLTPTMFSQPRELTAADFRPSFQGLAMTRHWLYEMLNRWRARWL